MLRLWPVHDFDSSNRMIQYEKCFLWFHWKCQDVPKQSFKNKFTLVWFTVLKREVWILFFQDTTPWQDAGIDVIRGRLKVYKEWKSSTLFYSLWLRRRNSIREIIATHRKPRLRQKFRDGGYLLKIYRLNRQNGRSKVGQLRRRI